jgi:hypothetical protein
MIKSIVGSIAYNMLRRQAPLFFLFADVANAFIPKPQEIIEPENIIKAKSFFNFDNVPTVEQIKKRYKELAKIHHPDKQSGSEDKMKLLNMHYEVLMNYYKE